MEVFQCGIVLCDGIELCLQFSLVVFLHGFFLCLVLGEIHFFAEGVFLGFGEVEVFGEVLEVAFGEVS